MISLKLKKFVKCLEIKKFICKFSNQSLIINWDNDRSKWKMFVKMLMLI
jgi:hypothetical protein